LHRNGFWPWELPAGNRSSNRDADRTAPIRHARHWILLSRKLLSKRRVVPKRSHIMPLQDMLEHTSHRDDRSIYKPCARDAPRQSPSIGHFRLISLIEPKQLITSEHQRWNFRLGLRPSLAKVSYYTNLAVADRPRFGSTVEVGAAHRNRSDLLDAGLPQFRSNPVLPGFAILLSLTGHQQSP